MKMHLLSLYSDHLQHEQNDRKVSSKIRKQQNQSVYKNITGPRQKGLVYKELNC